MSCVSVCNYPDEDGPCAEFNCWLRANRRTYKQATEPLLAEEKDDRQA